MDINSAAPVIARDEILISAPIETIWDTQTNIEEWPCWQRDVDGAELDGPPVQYCLPTAGARAGLATDGRR